MTSQTETSKSMNFSLVSIILLVSVAIIWVGIRVAFPDNPTFLAGKQPDNLGVSAGKLAACPSTPNCVNSQSKDPEHYIEPLKYQDSPQEAIDRLQKIAGDLGQSKIIEEKNNYLRAEFTSRWMGFVDDVEFYVDENAKAIDLRSASRLGESDLGVNRDRLETIRNLFNSPHP